MVSPKANQRKTLVSDDNAVPMKILSYLSIIVVFELLLLTLITVNKKLLSNDNLAVGRISISNDLPSEIDFQPIVDEWVNSFDSMKSVIIYDLDRNEIAGEYNSSASYYTASLYKLFVAYEGYTILQSGEWKDDDACGKTGLTILNCLDLAIRESDSKCAETLWSMIGTKKLDKIMKEKYDITDSDLANFATTPKDVLKMMTIYYGHLEISDEALLARMRDSLLNQPETDYNWRQGLPSGFKNANVYNKVGWDYNFEEEHWNYYHDAAIIEYPEDNRHFVVVVMTKNTPYQKLRELGNKIEDNYYNQ
ncbi:serine hydrolase [Candidatus Saccharibacteria bacterium]|nr:serine hydrolase [Candidatus Saccharibacteria bacterium]